MAPQNGPKKEKNQECSSQRKGKCCNQGNKQHPAVVAIEHNLGLEVDTNRRTKLAVNGIVRLQIDEFLKRNFNILVFRQVLTMSLLASLHYLLKLDSLSNKREDHFIKLINTFISGKCHPAMNSFVTLLPDNSLNIQSSTTTLAEEDLEWLALPCTTTDSVSVQIYTEDL